MILRLHLQMNNLHDLRSNPLNHSNEKVASFHVLRDLFNIFSGPSTALPSRTLPPWAFCLFPRPFPPYLYRAFSRSSSVINARSIRLTVAKSPACRGER